MNIEDTARAVIAKKNEIRNHIVGDHGSHVMADLAGKSMYELADLHQSLHPEPIEQDGVESHAGIRPSDLTPDRLLAKTPLVDKMGFTWASPNQRISDQGAQAVQAVQTIMSQLARPFVDEDVEVEQFLDTLADMCEEFLGLAEDLEEGDPVE